MSMVTTLLLGTFLAGTALLEDPSTVRLSLELPSFAGQSCTVKMNEDLTNNWQGVTVAEGQFADDGKLELSFNATTGELARVSSGRTFRRLWLVPGDLAITPSGNSWAYDGAGAVENSLLEALALNMPVQTMFGNFDFTARYDDLMERRDRALARIANHLGERQDVFRRYVEAEVHARAINSLANELGFARTTPTFNADDLPADAMSFWDELPQFDDAVGAASARYRQALAGKLGYDAEVAGSDPSVNLGAWALASLDVYAHRLEKHPRTHEALAASLLDFMTQYCEPAATIRGLDDFAWRFPESRSNAPLSEAFMRTINLDADALATIAFIDLAGEPRSLPELHGRRVYIDFWGSWCKACMLLTPQLRALHDDINAADAVILGVNMNESADIWRRAVADKDLPGLQWKPATPDDEAHLTELVQLRSFPRFVLLAEDGAVLSPTAPTPDNARSLLTPSR